MQNHDALQVNHKQLGKIAHKFASIKGECMKSKEKTLERIFFIIATVILDYVLCCRDDLSYEVFIGCSILAIIYNMVLASTIHKISNYVDSKFEKKLWIIIIALSWCIFVASFTITRVVWDTWQMYDMSKYVFSDFGYMDQIRQHITYSHYEMAFPPLFPVLMRIINFITDLGPYSAVYINGVIVLLIYKEIARIFKCSKYKITSIVTTFYICCGSLYILVFSGGINQIAGYYLLALIVRIIYEEKEYSKDFAVKIGICAGLMLMNRFDALAIVAVMCIVFPILMVHKVTWKRILETELIYILVLLIICSPWIVYSEIHFNSIFITDNGRRLLNIPDTRPSTFFPMSAPAKTIFDSFPEWLCAFSSRCIATGKSLVYSIIRHSIVIEMICLGVFVKKKYRIMNDNKGIKLHENRDHLVLILLIISQEMLYILSGYTDLRYHLLFLFMLMYLVLNKLIRLYEEKKLIGFMKKSLILFGIYSYMKIGYLFNPYDIVTSIMTGGGYANDLTLNAEEKELQDYLTYDCQTICFYRAENEFDFLKFSAEAQISNIISPANLSTDNVYEFVQVFEVNYLYSSNEETVKIFESKYVLNPTEHKNLYKVERLVV